MRKPRAIIANLKERTVVDMLKTRNKDPLWMYFHSKLEWRQVELVTMDMWRPYRDVVRSTFPGVPVVIDKFHVVRMASHAQD